MQPIKIFHETFEIARSSMYGTGLWNLEVLDVKLNATDFFYVHVCLTIAASQQIINLSITSQLHNIHVDD